MKLQTSKLALLGITVLTLFGAFAIAKPAVATAIHPVSMRTISVGTYGTSDRHRHHHHRHHHHH